MASKVCFENFYGKSFGTLIWGIVKSTFFKNTIRNAIILYTKFVRFHFFELSWRNVGKVMIVFTICFFDREEDLTFFKFENVY